MLNGSKALMWNEDNLVCILYSEYGEPIEDCRNGLINRVSLSSVMHYREALERCPGTIHISLKIYKKLRALFFK